VVKGRSEDPDSRGNEDRVVAQLMWYFVLMKFIKVTKSSQD
jgi:hypothetical protein